MTPTIKLPPGQQLVAPGKWPAMGERSSRADASLWTVEVGGAVKASHTFSIDDLRSLPLVEKIVDVHCVTRWSKPGVRFGGVPLAALLELAAPTATARYVSFVARSAQGHNTSLMLHDALGLDALVALEVDGTPLQPQHGGPVRMVVPQRYFYKSVKWLERIELLVSDRLGTWESVAGYHNTADPALEQRYIAPGLSRAQVSALLRGREMSGRDLRGLDVRGHDLAGLIAEGALLRNADFRDCRLRGACFDGANLTNAHLQGADLRDATFRGADLAGTDFVGADLRGACLMGSSFVAATFCELAGDTDNALRGVLLDRNTRFPADHLDELTPAQQTYMGMALSRAGAFPL